MKCCNTTTENKTAPYVPVTKLCGYPEIPQDHDIKIQHICEGIENHPEEYCVCRCGYYWSKTATVSNEPKDSIGE